MSRTVDLFLDSDQPLERHAELGDLMGHPLVALPDRTRYVLSEGRVNAFLSEHDFLDDDDLPLSEFRYVLSACVTATASIEESPRWNSSARSTLAWRQVSGCLPCLSSTSSVLIRGPVGTR